MKMIMAVSGLLLVLFAIAHMAGNLQVFLGRDQINAYARGLRDLGPLLWIARAGLIVLVLIHIAAAISLTRANRAARPVPYAYYRPVVTSYAARTMFWSGLIIAAFVVYHLLHFTLHQTNPGFATLHDPYGRHDVYTMVVKGFSVTWVVAAYAVAVGLLCAHLWHGVPSFFQSLGLNHPKYNGLIDKLGPLVAVLLFVGYVSVPIGVLAGVLKLPAGVTP
jgi:succinate dehydrogenase / fumarate reductase cytochrome b subunit